LRKVFSIIGSVCVLLMLLSGACFAQAQEANIDGALEWLEPAVGDWYSTKGNLAMTIQDKYINACQILSASELTFGYPRSGNFEVAETGQNRTLKLELFGHNVHQYLLVDGKLLLRRSLRPEYFESLGGIYLGMTEEELLHYYGKPSSKVNDGDMVRWEYDKDKFAVEFKSNIVVAMRLYKLSSRHFDRSGLGAADSPENYAQVYSMEETPVIPKEANTVSAAYAIGHGEFMSFSPDYTQLSVFKN